MEKQKIENLSKYLVGQMKKRNDKKKKLFYLVEKKEKENIKYSLYAFIFMFLLHKKKI